jgi:asparagine synthase (glutamine-hydrolysing)
MLRHRGPDDDGVFQAWLGSGVSFTLAFARLAIQDLSDAAAQPFTTESGTLAFNGEVYNFHELRRDLQGLGVSIGSSGDTEVLARLLTVFGTSGLERVEGMFALAWWDSVQDRLFLARDAFGEKPLLWMKSESDLWFASEPRALAAIAGTTLVPNQAQIERFLVNGYKSLHKTTETFFEGVNALPPGAALVFDASARLVAQRNMWRPCDSDSIDEDMSYEYAVGGVRDRLVQAIQMRLRADVELGITLSGGIDSTVIAAIATRLLGKSMKAFTIASGDPLYDDSGIASQTASSLGLDHQVVTLDRASFITNLEDLVAGRGEPIATVSSYAQAILMRSIGSSGVRVVLEGIGADEIFSGYYDHHLAFLADMYNSDPAVFDRALEAWIQKTQPHVRNPYLRNARYLVDAPASREHIYLDAPEFGKFLRRDFREAFHEEAIGTPILRRRMLNELMYETVPLLLREADFNAMASSVENRSPYLDRDLTQWMSKVPTRHLVRAGLAKSILRDAARPWAPAEVLNDSQKRGFNLGIGQLVDLGDHKTRRELLRESPIWEIVDIDQMRELVRTTQRLRNSQSKFLFSFLSTRAFLEL